MISEIEFSQLTIYTSGFVLLREGFFTHTK